MGKSWKEFKEHSVKSGVGTALCYMLPSESKYHILAPVESLPAVFGTPNTIEYSTTTNWSITNVRGKNTTENVEVNIAYNLDNIAIAEKVKGQKVRYAYIDLDDFTAQEFVAEASYHIAEIGTDGIKTIVLTLAVSSAEESITEDVYDMFMDTITFEDTIPSVVRLSLTETDGTTIKVTCEPSDATITATNSSESVVTSTYATGTLTLKPKAKGSAIVTIKATGTDVADNSRKIKVIVE